MKPEAQRIAIAEACGWKHFGCTGCACTPCRCNEWIHEDHGPCELPDYLTDLNAMHEAEKILSAPQIDEYKHRLMGAITDKERISQCATAAQRAEAFLRTLNLWTE